MGLFDELNDLIGLGGDNTNQQGLVFGPHQDTLLDIFGLSMGVHEHGDDAGQVYFYRDPNKTNIFEDLPEQLLDIIQNPLGFEIGEQEIFDFINQPGRAQEQLASAMDIFGQLEQIGLEGAQTGFPTSAQPAFDEALRLLNKDVLPQVAETASSQYGISSSPFIAQSARSAEDLLGKAALTQIGLEEAARGRQLGFLGLAPQITTAGLALPTAFGSDLFSLSQQRRMEEERQRYAPLNIFTTLSGMSATPIFQQGYNLQDTPTDVLGVFGDLFGTEVVRDVLGGFF